MYEVPSLCLCFFQAQSNHTGGSLSKSKGKMGKTLPVSSEEDEEGEVVQEGRGRGEYRVKMSKHQLKKARREERKV